MHHARMLPEGWDCFAGAAFDGQRAAYEPEGEWHKLVEPLAEKVRIMLMELYSVSVSANIVVVFWNIVVVLQGNTAITEQKAIHFVKLNCSCFMVVIF